MIPLLSGHVTQFCHPAPFHGYPSKAGTSASLCSLNSYQGNAEGGICRSAGSPGNSPLLGTKSIMALSISDFIKYFWRVQPPYPDPLLLQSCVKVISYQHTFYLSGPDSSGPSLILWDKQSTHGAHFRLSVFSHQPILLFFPCSQARKSPAENTNNFFTCPKLPS